MKSGIVSFPSYFKFKTCLKQTAVIFNSSHAKELDKKINFGPLKIKIKNELCF